MPTESAQEEIARLRSENTALRAKATNRLTFRVSPKGGVSVYGLSRFPVTLYKSQWEHLLTAVPELQAFIAAHDEELAVKALAVKVAA